MRARRLARVEVSLHALQQVAQAHRILVAGLGGLARRGRRAFSTRVEVGEREFGVDDVDVAEIGSILPATCTMSSLTKQRTTCAIASVSRMCARNLLPSPSPFEAPATRPAMSTNSTVVGRIFSGLTIAGERLQAQVRHRHDADVRVDGAERIVPAAAICARVSALKSVDLPTFGSPTMPHLMPIVVLLLAESRSYARRFIAFCGAVAQQHDERVGPASMRRRWRSRSAGRARAAARSR